MGSLDSSRFLFWMALLLAAWVPLPAGACGVMPQAWVHESRNLLNQQQWEDARALCEKHLTQGSPSEQAEAHGCLASVALSRAAGTGVATNGRGQTFIREVFRGEGVDEALNHVTQAIHLDPARLCLHHSRMEIAIMAERVSALPAQLDESMDLYGSQHPDTVNDWLNPGFMLFEDGWLKPALDYFKVMEKRFPNDHRVVANIGGVLMALEKDEEALPYVKRAVELAPKDPINTWNLGRLYDFMDRNDEAEPYYLRGISLETNRDKKKLLQCTYAGFLETKRKDLKKACSLQQKTCPKEKQTACR